MPAVRKAAKRSPKARPSCFVISPIGDEGSPERGRADKVLRHIITPGVQRAGYAKPVKADKMPAPGIITERVVREVAEASLVVADLTEHNPNVFYELAIRHALQKPLIQLIEGTQRLPFDVAEMRTIRFDVRDLDSAAAARDEITAQIKHLDESETPMPTPISVARAIKTMWENDEPAGDVMADMYDQLSALRGEVQRLRSPSFYSGLEDPPRIGMSTVYSPATASGLSTESVSGFTSIGLGESLRPGDALQRRRSSE